MTRNEFVQQFLSGKASRPQDRGHGQAPANIALCKYWGKRDAELNLPRTDSLSISLGRLGTETTIERGGDKDAITLNGELVRASDSFARRLTAYLDLFRQPGEGYRVETSNSVPTAAGVASSASGFAALVRALNELNGWQLSGKEQSILARIGSGSAARSVFDGFVHWHAGNRDDGSDCFAERLPAEWPELRIGLSLVTHERKATSSTDGMNRTVDTSILYNAWPEQVQTDMQQIRDAIDRRDLQKLGEAAERNALAMHATMLAATPPLLYWKEQTVRTIQHVWELRQSGTCIFLTMDAGPNVKLIFDQAGEDVVREHFPDVDIVAPFAG